MAAHRSLTAITLGKCALPVRDLLGLSPHPHGSGGPATSINLQWSSLSAIDATVIGALIRANRTITAIDLSWNSDLAMAGSDGAVSLAEAIASNRNLTSVNLSETSIGDRCAAAMCRAINQNSALRTLNLRCCGLSSASREMLSRAAAQRTRSAIEVILG